jgi:hypothetical protein
MCLTVELVVRKVLWGFWIVKIVMAFWEAVKKVDLNGYNAYVFFA